LTIAASEVTERRGVPMVTESFADDVTDREGFSHIFGYAPPSSQLAELMSEAVIGSLESTGVDLTKVAIIGDNSPGGTPLQEGLIKALKAKDVDVALYEQWTPPLQDASGVAQKIANADAQAVLLIAFSFNDVSSLVKQVRARGVTVPIIQSGGQGIVPQWRQVGKSIEGMSSFVYTNPLSKSKDLTTSIAEATGQDYVWQDQIGGYVAISLIAAALEEAGATDPKAVTEALHDLDLSEGSAVDLLPMPSISFDENGRIATMASVLAQWQTVDGELVPCTVYPADVAVCEGKW
jgi:branched-chain amino acid transport system substrate-binding protein